MLNKLKIFCFPLVVGLTTFYNKDLIKQFLMLFFYRLINLRNASYPNNINNGSTIIPNDTTVICQDNSGEVSNLCSLVVVKKNKFKPGV